MSEELINHINSKGIYHLHHIYDPQDALSPSSDQTRELAFLAFWLSSGKNK